jgi:hypothetical protein
MRALPPRVGEGHLAVNATPCFVDQDGTEYHVSPRTAQMIRVVIAKAGRIRSLKVVQVTLDVRGDSVGCRVTEIDPPQGFTEGGEWSMNKGAA